MDYQQAALLYAEKYGIVEYTVNGNIMTYDEAWHEATYACTVNLDTMDEKRIAK